MPALRVDRHGAGLVAAVQGGHVGHELRVEDEQHHLKIQMQAAFVEIDGAK